jgi:hypothetical protein
MRNMGQPLKAAMAHGWITLHPSGVYLSFTQAGADLFAQRGNFGVGGQRFFDPIEFPGRKPLVTLHDAALYITKLPKAAHDAEEWQSVLRA